MNKRQQAGFTLIEIAIVLVIIGLLLGGVLKGQELITNARVKNVTNDFNGVSASIYAYQDRYRALPGDDANANTRFTLPDGANDNGDSNGTIAGAWSNASGSSNETRQVWLHLRAAQLIAGATTNGADGEGGNQPQNAFGGLVGVDATNVGLTGLVGCMGGIPGRIATILDTQGDDGASDTGSIRVSTTNNYDGATATASAYTSANDNTAMTLCRLL